MDEVILQPLQPGDKPAALELLSILNPSTPPAELEDRLTAILSNHPHYQITGAYVSGKLVGLCGAWIATKIWCGKYLELDNLIVHPDHRSANIGTLLIRHFEKIAKEENCKILTLDSYTSNHPSHRLYHRLGFEIWGFHFVKPLDR
jgi:ribosomal protein S18 acetylase RimI-like enzyme